ncbi:type II secretory pathway pseudopilin PulG [Janthinobacterium sp. CG_23.3]|uniref:type II secretion system protein n=1 Tax=Janthinobacterium sp. CG_23.3 TaxID=3349634 RepID=UPI0038D380D8
MQAGPQRGFTYLAVLFAVAISSIVLGGALAMWSIDERRDREAELLFAGGQVRQAIASYYEGTPGADKHYPANLNELLADSRVTPARHHLRRLYADPITGAPWALVRGAGGGVMGVYSPSAGAPLKRANFGESDALFAGKTQYADWKFVYQTAHNRNEPAVILPWR